MRHPHRFAAAAVLLLPVAGLFGRADGEVATPPAAGAVTRPAAVAPATAPAATSPAVAEPAVAEPRFRAGPVPPAEVERLGLKPFYAKYVSADGFPVVGSARVNDYALAEAAYLVRHLLAHRPDVRAALTANKVRLAVMAWTELTTDVPEHADLAPKAYWDRRARGLGPTPVRPAVSCGEENLLCLPGDPYAAENLLVHEFGHAVHEMGVMTVDPTFDQRLRAAYAAAVAAGRWAGTYAGSNHHEYWGEGTQSWFDTNRANDAQHNDVDTREKLKAYDSPLAALLAEVYGDGPWRYRRPAARPAAERAHLAGFDPAAAGAFAWPKKAD